MTRRPTRSITRGSFPELEGESLAHQRMRIPGDLPGDINLLFVAFLQDQQFEVNKWLRRISDLETQHQRLEILEIPLLRRFPGFYRSWINNGMRSGIPDPRVREHTVTVYTDRRDFLKRAGLPNVARIWTVLVDRSGTIFWSHLGGVSDEAENSLRWAVKQLT